MGGRSGGGAAPIATPVTATLVPELCLLAFRGANQVGHPRHTSCSRNAGCRIPTAVASCEPSYYRCRAWQVKQHADFTEVVPRRGGFDHPSPPSHSAHNSNSPSTPRRSDRPLWTASNSTSPGHVHRFGWLIRRHLRRHQLKGTRRQRRIRLSWVATTTWTAWGERDQPALPSTWMKSRCAIGSVGDHCGSSAIARATATRCCWPPLMSPGGVYSGRRD